MCVITSAVFHAYLLPSMPIYNTMCRSSYIQITIPCFCIKMICCFNDVHRLVNKMIVLLSEDLLIEFLLCHADIPSLQHLSFWSGKNLSKVNYVYVYAHLYCIYAIYIYIYYKHKHIYQQSWEEGGWANNNEIKYYVGMIIKMCTLICYMFIL